LFVCSPTLVPLLAWRKLSVLDALLTPAALEEPLAHPAESTKSLTWGMSLATKRSQVMALALRSSSRAASPKQDENSSTVDVGAAALEALEVECVVLIVLQHRRTNLLR